MPLVGLEMPDVGRGGFDAPGYLLLRKIELSATLADYVTERAFIRPCHGCVSFSPRQQRAPRARRIRTVISARLTPCATNRANPGQNANARFPGDDPQSLRTSQLAGFGTRPFDNCANLLLT